MGGMSGRSICSSLGRSGMNSTVLTIFGPPRRTDSMCLRLAPLHPCLGGVTLQKLSRPLWQGFSLPATLALADGRVRETPQGNKWTNPAGERQRREEKPQRGKGENMEIYLNQTLWLGDVLLKHGFYQVVFLERDANQGHLYFFPGARVNPQNIAPMTPVQGAAPAREVTAVELTYREDEGISEIRTRQKVFRLQ